MGIHVEPLNHGDDYRSATSNFPMELIIHRYRIIRLHVVHEKLICGCLILYGSNDG